jgi:Cephalosporin hydroxylase
MGSIYHTHARVLAELQDCAPLPSTGSHRVVYHTLVEDVPADMFPRRRWGPGDNPNTAVQDCPRTHTAFRWIEHPGQAADHGKVRRILSGLRGLPRGFANAPCPLDRSWRIGRMRAIVP